MIRLLTQETIDRIAAGEVIERPASIVKELVENAMDAGAKGITVEIRAGGRELIRVTDNGHGILREEVRPAFMRHATSKIKDAEDLETVMSLGFRGEALSSIAAVSRIELITKHEEELTGSRYCMDGGKETVFEEVGAPEGSTFIVRDLFFNVPARRKFLKSVHTESSHIGDIVEKLALSRTDIAFHFIRDKKSVLVTTGNENLKDIIYQIYGKETAANLLPVSFSENGMSVTGYAGAPFLSKSTRNTEVYFLNGRYIKDRGISLAIEEGYGTKLMQHKFPFCILRIGIDPRMTDCNVHPGKMEVRFADSKYVCDRVSGAVAHALAGEEIEKIILPENGKKEAKRSLSLLPGREPDFEKKPDEKRALPEPFEKVRYDKDRRELSRLIREHSEEKEEKTFFFQPRFLKDEEVTPHRLIGQIFLTYWLIEYNEELYIVDQHAAHEKVLFEKMLKDLRRKEIFSQNIAPPLVLHLTESEAGVYFTHQSLLLEMGFEMEHFGGREYKVSAVPAFFPSISKEELLRDLIGELAEEKENTTSEKIAAKIASLACKAAIKANHSISFREADILIREMLSLSDPYHCPHGRPTVIRISKGELERKFKRIL